MNVAFWWLAIVVGFIGPLVLAAAIVESRFSRSWIRRLKSLERGRQAQRYETKDFQ